MDEKKLYEVLDAIRQAPSDALCVDILRVLITQVVKAERLLCAGIANEALRVRGERFYGETVEALILARGGK